MRRSFPELDAPSQAEIDELWQHALIVPDTNILLHALRFSSGTVEEMLTIFRKFSDRLWLSHHVGLEFYQGKNSVISAAEEAYKKVMGVYREARGRFDDQLKKVEDVHRKHPIDFRRHNRTMAGFVDKKIAALTTEQEKHPSSQDLISRIEEMFDGKVGPFLDPLDVSAEAMHRFIARIPPGYKDGDEKKGIGDFVIWKQMLSEAKRRNSSLMFITDDTKEDWWETGQVRPRQELVREFRRETGKLFHAHTLETFLKVAKQREGSKVSDETLSEIRTGALQAELEAAEQELAEVEAAAERAEKAEREHWAYVEANKATMSEMELGRQISSVGRNLSKQVYWSSRLVMPAKLRLDRARQALSERDSSA